MLSFIHESRQAHRMRERIELKLARKQNKLEREAFLKISNLLNKVLSQDALEKIAKKTKFQKRSRLLRPVALVSVLMIGCTMSSDDNPIPLERLCGFLQKWFNIVMKPQSLQDQINRPQSANFISEVMALTMKYEFDKAFKKLMKKRRIKIHLFTRILIQDSTVISLPETLQRIFKGCGGSASKASVKCDCIIDQNNYEAIRIKCVAGKVPDSSMSYDILNYLKEGDLVIRDLGYFNLSQFSQIVFERASFISRLSSNVCVFLHRNDKEPVNLIEHLQKINIEKRNVDIDVYLGKKERLPVRLIAIKVPPEVIEARRQQYKRARGRSKEPSEFLQEWNGFTIMVTNIAKEHLSLKMVLKMYKIRWQIELFFKNMKSNLCIDKLTGTNKYRILCLIYVKLTIVWIVSLLYAYAQTIADNDREVSLFKFTKWLKELGGIERAFVTCDLSILLRDLQRSVGLLCKQKRKRKPTRQDIEDTNREKNIMKKAA